MFITTKRHTEVVADKDAEIAALRKEVARTGVLLTASRGDCARLRVEIEGLRSARERSLANLRNANAARSAKARAGLA